MTNTNTQTGGDDDLELAVAEELVLLRSKADLDAYYASTIEPAVPNSEAQAKRIFDKLSEKLGRYFDYDFENQKKYNEDTGYLRQAVLSAYHELLRENYNQKLIELMFAGMGFELRHDEGRQTLTGVRHVESGNDVPLIAENAEAMSLFWHENIKPFAPNSFQHMIDLWSRFGNQPHNLQKYQVTNPTPRSKYTIVTGTDLFNDVARAYYDNVGRYGKLADLVLKAMGFELGFEGGNRIRTMRHTLSGRTFEYLRDENIVREVQPAEVVDGATGQVRDRLSGLLDPNAKI